MPRHVQDTDKDLPGGVVGLSLDGRLPVGVVPAMPSVADATDATSVITQFNQLLDRMRTAGMLEGSAPTPPAAPRYSALAEATELGTATEYGSGWVDGGIPYTVPTGAIWWNPTSGNDANNGTTKALAKKTLSASITAANDTRASTPVWWQADPVARSHVVLAEGSHRDVAHHITGSSNNNVTIMGEPGAVCWLDGSILLTSWTSDSGKWYSSGFTFEPTTTGPSGTTGLSAHPVQVWRNNVRLTMVATVGEVATGTFFHDRTNYRIYIGDDPAAATVEVTAYQRALRSTALHTWMVGFGIRRYAAAFAFAPGATYSTPGTGLGGSPTGITSGQGMSSVLHERSRWLFEHMHFTDCTGVAVSVGASGFDTSSGRVYHTGAYNNGHNGFNIGWADDTIVHRSVFDDNNWKGFPSGQQAAGMKIVRSRRMTITDNTFNDNNGCTGLWADVGCYDFLWTGNEAIDNGNHGFYFELSQLLRMYNNVAIGNGSRSFKCVAKDVDVRNNSFVGSANSAIWLARDQRRDPETARTDGASVTFDIDSRHITTANSPPDSPRVVASTHGRWDFNDGDGTYGTPAAGGTEGYYRFRNNLVSVAETSAEMAATIYLFDLTHRTERYPGLIATPASNGPNWPTWHPQHLLDRDKLTLNHNLYHRYEVGGNARPTNHYRFQQRTAPSTTATGPWGSDLKYPTIAALAAASWTDPAPLDANSVHVQSDTAPYNAAGIVIEGGAVDHDNAALIPDEICDLIGIARGTRHYGAFSRV
jgi:hypothetical protein